jgi:hypothetical protein
MVEKVNRFSSQMWFRLPLKLRQQWWRETEYGAHSELASAELLAAIEALASGEAR